MAVLETRARPLVVHTHEIHLEGAYAVIILRVVSFSKSPQNRESRDGNSELGFKIVSGLMLVSPLLFRGLFSGSNEA